MRRLTSILATALAWLLLPSCDKGAVPSGVGNDVQVLLVPSAYGAAGSPLTRAVNLDDTGIVGNPNYYYNGFLGAPTLTSLPVGTTVWLTYRRGEPVDPMPTSFATTPVTTPSIR